MILNSTELRSASFDYARINAPIILQTDRKPPNTSWNHWSPLRSSLSVRNGVCFFKNVRWVSPSFLTHAWYANINLAATCALGEQNMWKRPWSVMSSPALVGWVFCFSPSEVQPTGERTSLPPGWLDRLGETDWELKWSKMTGGCLWTTGLVFVAACVKVSCLGLLFSIWKEGASLQSGWRTSK